MADVPDAACAAVRPRSDEARDRAVVRGLAVGKVEHQLVDVAPTPALGRVISLDDRVPGGVEVRRRVTVGGRVAAADMPAGAADPKVHPGRADLQALLATE